MAKRLYKLGSLAQDTRTGLKTIFKLGLKDKYNTLEAPQDTDYQVPAGAVYYMTRIACIGDAANTVIQFLYGDDAVSDSAAAPTNPVIITPPYRCCTADICYPHDVFFEVPAGKYPAIHVTVGNAIAEVQGLQI